MNQVDDIVKNIYIMVRRGIILRDPLKEIELTTEEHETFLDFLLFNNGSRLYGEIVLNFYARVKFLYICGCKIKILIKA